HGSSLTERDSAALTFLAAILPRSSSVPPPSTVQRRRIGTQPGSARGLPDHETTTALAGHGGCRLWSNWRHPALSRRCPCIQRPTRNACPCAEPLRPPEAFCSYVPRGRIHMFRRCDHRFHSGRSPVTTCQHCRIHRNTASER